MWLPHLAITVVVAGAVQAAPQPGANSNDACRLLTFSEVREVQKVALRETKGSERRAGGHRHVTCVFATEDFAHSVSVTLSTATERPEALNEYWTRTFSPDREDGKPKNASATKQRKDPPLRRIEGIGTDAVWTGDSKAGSLYVLAPGGILRVSVGGVADVAERLRRSRELAAIALARLDRDPVITPRKLERLR